MQKTIISGLLLLNSAVLNFSCVVLPDVELDEYVGQWQLVEAQVRDSLSASSDISVILFSDSSFESTSRFFWDLDTSTAGSLNGTWYPVASADYYDDVYRRIVLTVDSTTRTWRLTGGTEEAEMLWYDYNLIEGQFRVQWELID